MANAVVKGLDDEVLAEVDVLICPPFTALESVWNRLSGSKLSLGAQNCSDLKEGARTGEISPLMLLDLGCKFVILGHSERRAYFGETDEFINSKIGLALECGLEPIVCIGETLEQREAGKTLDVLRAQLQGGLADLSEEDISALTIAYEPVWAIGTGRTATPETAQDAQRFIREVIDSSTTRSEVADSVRILYGGSVKPENARALLSQPDIDGALVGGASLDPESFISIIKSARSQ